MQRAAGRARPRLWWCVTGELGFLPIHAAGNFAHDRPECATDYVVSSYIPTLHSLVKAKRLFNTIHRTSLAGLIVCEELSESDAARHLPHAAGEVRLVNECFEAAQALVLNSISPHTSTSMLRALLQSAPAQILHLACHSIQDEDPLKNALVLQDGHFTIEDIMQLNLSHTVLAYLSACQTAKGHKSAPDQAIHIAASMLFCGVRSVVGTMWCVS
jgi:CHAT domain-containing protein